MNEAAVALVKEPEKKNRDMFSEVNNLVKKGEVVREACEKIGMTESSYYYWKKFFSNMAANARKGKLKDKPHKIKVKKAKVKVQVRKKYKKRVKNEERALATVTVEPVAIKSQTTREEIALKMLDFAMELLRSNH